MRACVYTRRKRVCIVNAASMPIHVLIDRLQAGGGIIMESLPDRGNERDAKRTIVISQEASASKYALPYEGNVSKSCSGPGSICGPVQMRGR
eukprot:6201398-Pleurochrysis_carterae.AAC.1